MLTLIVGVILVSLLLLLVTLALLLDEVPHVHDDER